MLLINTNRNGVKNFVKQTKTDSQNIIYVVFERFVRLMLTDLYQWKSVDNWKKVNNWTDFRFLKSGLAIQGGVST